MTINHLRSNRYKHLANHFELRGHPEIGYSWWLVFDRTDSKPIFIGAEHELPDYALAELEKLRRPPRLGNRRRARHIGATMVFLPTKDHNGITHEQNVEWLRQYKRRGGAYSENRGYLVVLDGRNEDYPLEIWESRPKAKNPAIDQLDSEYELVWKRGPND